MAKRPERFSWTGWGVSHATRHANAAATYAQKLSQATDLHDRFRAHAEFVHMYVDMCNERAKLLNDAVAVAGNLMGAFVSILHRGKFLEDIAARNAPAASSHTPSESHAERPKRNRRAKRQGG
jgi:hypothetical protein